MKKLLTILLVVTLIVTSLFCFGACTDSSAIEIYVPDGAPALAVASLMKEGATLGGKPVNVTIGTGASVKQALVSGQADIAILPTTACAGLFKQGKDIRLHSVTTWGVLYLIGQEAGGLQDLVGEVVYSIGRNDTPGILLRKYLDHYDIEYVESQTPVEGKVAITYVEDAKNVIPNLKAGSVKYALLGEPAVNNVLSSTSLQIIVDMQQEWKKITQNTTNGYPQAGVILTPDVYNNTKLVNELSTKLLQNDTYIIQNPDEVDALLTSHGSTSAGSSVFTSQVLTRCNITTIKASDCFNELLSYYQALSVAAPTVDMVTIP